jgi:hypothetical protein
MSFDDDSRAPETLIENALDLAALQRVLKLGQMIRETAERRRRAGKTEPRGLGS